MSCNCELPDKTPLWTPVPEYRQPSIIQSKENIDCFSKRAGSVSGLKNDIGGKTANLIDNTSLTSDINRNVSVTFSLTPSSTRVPTSWQIAVNGSDGLNPLSELTFDSSTGLLSGTVSEANANQLYKVMITAVDANGQIDAREFNFYPKKGTKDDTVQFQFPLQGSTGSRISCGFGPRTPPTAGASTQHNGIDIAMLDHSLGDIVATADGTVVKAGTATGFGNWIVIEHHDAQDRLVATSVYGHMNDGDIYVTVGQKVAGGQKIAKEGSAGLSSGAHLHFEIHKGAWRNPVDPVAYLNSTMSVATDNDASTDGPDGTPNPTGFTSVTNTAAGMTSGESTNANADCPSVLPADENLSTVATTTETAPAAPSSNVGKNRSSCAPSTGTPSGASVIAAIQAACAANSNLTSYDAQWIQTVAAIESNYDPYAKNPTSSATGLYQFLDALAVKYYGIIGIPVSCQTRCDSTYATQAMIAFYLAEIKPYWTSYQQDQSQISGKTIITTSWSAQYPNLNQGEFLYSLHHDGVGNVVAGKDLGGVSYWRSKVGTS